MTFRKKKISLKNYLLFGELHCADNLLQCRFIVQEKDEENSAFFAPYRMTPIEVEEIKITNDTLHIHWHYHETSYSCKLFRDRHAKHLEFTGKCDVGEKHEYEFAYQNII
jgi:hypothetical protein